MFISLMEMCILQLSACFYRVVAWWRTKYPENVIKGYKMNLQHALGTRIPNGILNFFFKFTFARKVGAGCFTEEPQQCLGLGLQTPRFSD